MQRSMRDVPKIFIPISSIKNRGGFFLRLLKFIQRHADLATHH